MAAAAPTAEADICTLPEILASSALPLLICAAVSASGAAVPVCATCLILASTGVDVSSSHAPAILALLSLTAMLLTKLLAAKASA